MFIAHSSVLLRVVCGWTVLRPVCMEAVRPAEDGGCSSIPELQRGSRQPQCLYGPHRRHIKILFRGTQKLPRIRAWNNKAVLDAILFIFQYQHCKGSHFNSLPSERLIASKNKVTKVPNPESFYLRFSLIVLWIYTCTSIHIHLFHTTGF